MSLPLLLAFFAGLVVGLFFGLFWKGRSPSAAERAREDLIEKVYGYEKSDNLVDDLRHGGWL